MAILAESTTNRILVSISGIDYPVILERLFYKENNWLVWTGSGFADPLDESTIPLPINASDFVDSFNLTSGLYQYRIHKADILEPEYKDYQFCCWTKFGVPDAVGYSFNNYKVPEGSWGTIVTPDDCRYTFLWGTDFKAANGSYFTDEQIQWFIDAATREMERQLNITIIKKRIKSMATIESQHLVKGVDYDVEETPYDFSYRKIQRYGMIQTKQRPILDITRCTLINKGQSDDVDLLPSVIPDKKNGVIKFMKRPFKPNDTWFGITDAISRYGSETWNPHIFYVVDYDAGFENSDEVPSDLRQMIGKMAAISLLNVIGDGLMSGFSSSSLSMDGVSESFSSTQSATSAYFGARIAVYQKEVQEYIAQNKYKFGFFRVGSL
ncbi:MAG: hypothetical protein J6W16_07195 [Methanobrevibacter sp.]|nr:hypothetical protein [Methanobrevibacter sp.]MBP5785349.1 hypothetical protein [Methanobrevibacter sp.]